MLIVSDLKKIISPKINTLKLVLSIKKNNKKEIKDIPSMFHECKRCEIDRSRKVLLFKGKSSEYSE